MKTEQELKERLFKMLDARDEATRKARKDLTEGTFMQGAIMFGLYTIQEPSTNSHFFADMKDFVDSIPVPSKEQQ